MRKISSKKKEESNNLQCLHFNMVQSAVNLLSAAHGIHCGCDDLGRGHGSSCENGSGNDVANGICRNGEVVCFDHLAGYDQRTSQPGCGFHSISFHPTSELHPQRHVCPRIQRKQNRVDYGQPKRSSMGRTFRMRFRFHALMLRSLDYQHILYIEGPIPGSVPLCLYCCLCSNTTDLR